MAKNHLLLIVLFLAQQLNGQNPGEFYFTVTSPSNIYQSLAPGEYGTVGTGWGWNGTIPNDFFAEMVYVTEDMYGDHTFCEADAVDYTGKVVLVERGLCDFSQKAFNAQVQGAVALVIRNFDENILHMAPGDFSMDVTIPTIMITESVGDNILSELLIGSTVIVGFSNTPNPITQISGTVILDDNTDCMSTPGETSLQGWKIFTSGSNSFSKINYSDANGHYQLFVDTGTYEVSLIAPSALWNVCPPVTVTSTSYDSFTVDLHAQVLVDCPLLSVDIEAPFLRRCFDNNDFIVKYCNYGTVIAESAYVTVQFDDLISIISSSIPYTVLADNTYEFFLGDLESNECGSFTITTLVACDAELSQTLCAIANIYPQVNCDSTGESYTGPFVKVNGTCTGAEVSFQIENRGLEDMDEPGSYTVFRNAMMLETGSFQLGVDESSEYHFPADGATYRLAAAQAAGFPEASSPSLTIEACTNGLDDFETGFFNMFPPADYGAAYDEACIVVTGSFDPNDKAPTPLGYGNDHWVERNTDIHYLIRFQNTGTDTAFTVIVRDTLSGLFDISSLVLGIASHDYTFNLLGNNVLEFRFQNILLPDSNVNETASHGFLTYQLKQKEQLALGSVVKNAAAIYFDYNQPVITNETFHTIGEHFIETTGLSEFGKNISVHVYPNPMKDYIFFTIENVEFQEGRLELYNGMGQLARVEKFREQSFEVKRKALTVGSYFFKLMLDDQIAYTGVVQVLDIGH